MAQDAAGKTLMLRLRRATIRSRVQREAGTERLGVHLSQDKKRYQEQKSREESSQGRHG